MLYNGVMQTFYTDKDSLKNLGLLILEERAAKVY